MMKKCDANSLPIAHTVKTYLLNFNYTSIAKLKILILILSFTKGPSIIVNVKPSVQNLLFGSPFFIIIFIANYLFEKC